MEKQREVPVCTMAIISPAVFLMLTCAAVAASPDVRLPRAVSGFELGQDIEEVDYIAKQLGLKRIYGLNDSYPDDEYRNYQPVDSRAERKLRIVAVMTHGKDPERAESITACDSAGDSAVKKISTTLKRNSSEVRFKDGNYWTDRSTLISLEGDCLTIKDISDILYTRTSVIGQPGSVTFPGGRKAPKSQRIKAAHDKAGPSVHRPRHAKAALPRIVQGFELGQTSSEAESVAHSYGYRNIGEKEKTDSGGAWIGYEPERTSTMPKVTIRLEGGRVDAVSLSYTNAQGDYRTAVAALRKDYWAPTSEVFSRAGGSAQFPKMRHDSYWSDGMTLVHADGDESSCSPNCAIEYMKIGPAGRTVTTPTGERHLFLPPQKEDSADL